MRRKEREVKDLNTLEQIIERCDVCRIALFDKETPYIVTLNFGYIRSNPSKIYFHCSLTGKKIDLIRSNNNVCFQMDTDHELITGDKACSCGMSYKSIVGQGKIYIVEDEGERIEGLNILMSHYTGNSNYTFEERVMKNTLILRLEISSLTGKMNV